MRRVRFHIRSDTVSRACQEAGVVILRDFSHAAPCFADAPAVAPLAAAAALPRLAAHLFGRTGSQASQLVWALGTALGQAALWELTLGTPSDSAQAVLDVLARSRPTS